MIEEQLELDGMPPTPPCVKSAVSRVETEAPEIPAWVPTTCPQCDGSGSAPGDGRTECGFCVGGQLTPALRAELAAAWGPILAGATSSRRINIRS